MFQGEAFGTAVKGTPEFADSITAKALTQAYEALLRSSRVECFYVGGEEECRVLEETGAIFASRCYERAEEVALVMHPAPAVPRVFEEDSESLQGKLIMGFSHEIGLWEKDYRAVPMMLEVLSGSPTSQLFMNVREKLSLCYYCRPIYIPLKGIMLVTSGIETSNFQQAKAAIIGELDAMKKGEISDEEMENGKRSLVNSFKMVTDNLGGIVSWGSGRRLYTDGRISTPEEFAEKVSGITKEQLVEVANRLVLDTVYLLKGEDK
jgi:predicted Zn-dependent peptidase